MSEFGQPQISLRGTAPAAFSSAISATNLRLAHSYVSAFIAPTIVFFALSGVLQILGLQDVHGTYKPSALISAIAGLHKHQVLAPEAQHDAAPGGSQHQGRAQGDQSRSQGAPDESGQPPRGSQGAHSKPRPTLATQLLKGLFVLEALALAATTVLGVWIGVTHPKRARTFWILLAAGALLPVVLIVL